MEKINLGSTVPAYPMPVSLVGAHVNGKPNFLAIAWFTMACHNRTLLTGNLEKRLPMLGVSASSIKIGMHNHT